MSHTFHGPHTNELPLSAFDTAHIVGSTSFGAAIYEGMVQHENWGRYQRNNTVVETVPLEPAYPDSAVVIGSGYSFGPDHYNLMQRELSVLGEHSVAVGHPKHRGYEIGDNAEDIAATCRELGRRGISEQVLVGHSQGAHEVLDAYEELEMTGSGVHITDIVLVDPACVVPNLSAEISRSAPMVAFESMYNFVRYPRQQVALGLRAMKNIVSDPVRAIKEGQDLSINVSVGPALDRIGAKAERPNVHVVVGRFDGLTSGTSIMKHMKGHKTHHDTLTMLRANHTTVNLTPKITDIIHAKVRGGRSHITSDVTVE